MSELTEILVSKLEAHPKNIRAAVAMDANLDELAAGIDALGLIHAIVVVPHPTAKTKYRVVAGHRRLAAVTKLGWKKVTCEVRTDLSEQAQRAMQYQENRHRVGNTIMERARYVADELELGGRKIAELAKDMGVSQEQVRTSKKLAKAPALAVAKLNDGQMTLEDGLILAEFNGDPDAQKALLDDWNTWNWRNTVQRLRNLRDSQKEAPKTKAILAAAGATVIDRPEGWTPEYRQVADDVTPEEHVAAGHVAAVDVDRTGKALWYQVQEPEADPVLSPEEQEAEAARIKAEEDLKAGLELAGQTRMQELTEMIATPRPGLAEQLLSKLVARTVRQRHGYAFIGLDKKATSEEVEARLLKMGLESMAVLEDVLDHSCETMLIEDLDGWGKTRWGSDYAKDWRDRLHDVYGHEWNDLERSFMDQCAAAYAKANPEEEDGDD